MTLRYTRGGITVTIGKSHEIQIPSRVVRAHCDCMHFDTDRSFLLPPSMLAVRNLTSFYAKHPGLTVLVNGHTDLVGNAAYNRQLSDERAASIAAFLQDKVDDWLAWYSSGIASKRWGATENQNMLQTLVDATGAPYHRGTVTGTYDAVTQDALRRFQADHGLGGDGQPNQDTHRALVTAYMALEGTSLPSDATLVRHGCGLFHPIDPTLQADQGNRRVEVFLFDGPVDPAPQNPCPAPGCTQYAKWVEQAIDVIDLCQPLPDKPHWDVELSASATPALALVIATLNGSEVLRLPHSEARSLGGARWRFDLSALETVAPITLVAALYDGATLLSTPIAFDVALLRRGLDGDDQARSESITAYAEDDHG